MYRKLYILIPLFIISCIDPNWQKTLEIDTIEAYTGYIKENPGSKHVEEAGRRIERLQFIEDSLSYVDSMNVEYFISQLKSEDPVVRAKAAMSVRRYSKKAIRTWPYLEEMLYSCYKLEWREYVTNSFRGETSTCEVASLAMIHIDSNKAAQSFIKLYETTFRNRVYYEDGTSYDGKYYYPYLNIKYTAFPRLGKLAVPYLLELFNRVKKTDQKTDIIGTFAEMEAQAASASDFLADCAINPKMAKNIRVSALSAIYRLGDHGKMHVDTLIHSFRTENDIQIKDDILQTLCYYGEYAEKIIPDLDKILTKYGNRCNFDLYESYFLLNTIELIDSIGGNAQPIKPSIYQFKNHVDKCSFENYPAAQYSEMLENILNNLE